MDTGSALSKTMGIQAWTTTKIADPLPVQIEFFIYPINDCVDCTQRARGQVVNLPKLVTRVIRVFQPFMFNPIFPGREIAQ